MFCVMHWLSHVGSVDVVSGTEVVMKGTEESPRVQLHVRQDQSYDFQSTARMHG